MSDFFRNAVVPIGLAVYMVAFYAAPLRNDVGSPIRDDRGEPMLRAGLVASMWLQRDEWLYENWFGRPPQFELSDRLPVFFAAVAIFAWAFVVGRLLLRLCKVFCVASDSHAPAAQAWTGLETFVFAEAIGLNVLSTWVLLAGLLGRLDRTWVCWGPAAATLAFVVGRRFLWKKREACDAPLRAPPVGDAHSPKNRENLLGPQWLWLAAPFVIAIFLAAAVPPSDFDVCEYHAQAPKEFFQQGRIAFLPHNVYANMAMGAEMLSLLGMVLTGDWWLGALVGKILIAAFTPLCALGLLAAGRRFHSTGAGVVAALVYVSIPWVVGVSSAGLVEGASACYLFLAVYAMLLPESRAATVVAGYLAGAAVATKYPAALFVLVPLAAWCFYRRGVGCVAVDEKLCSGRGTRSTEGEAAGGSQRIAADRRSPVQRLRSALATTTLFLAAAAAGCGLWFGKNWALAGNPTYPLLYGVFGGETWTPEKDARWNRAHRPHDFSIATCGRDLGRVALTGAWLSPLVVPLAALSLFRRKKLSTVSRGRHLTSGLWLYVGFVVAVWWLCTHRIDRFWIPVLPILALLAGLGVCWSDDRWWRRSLKCLLVFVLTINFLTASGGAGNAWFVPLDRLRGDAARTDPWHQYFNAHAPGERVLSVGDAAVFDLRSPVLYNTCFDDCIFEQMVRGRLSAEVRDVLRSRCVAYVFVHWGEIDRYRKTYGYSDFIRPEVFSRLVREGVLEPLPAIEGHPGWAYRVK